MKSTIIPNDESSLQSSTPSISESLQQAIAHHQAGQLQDAERIYRGILQAQPNHPDASHNLGVLAVQVKQPAAGLPYFKAALAANPNQMQYWLSYIDALIQIESIDTARQILEQGLKRGLSGRAFETLAARLSNAEKARSDQPAELDSAIAYREAGCYKEAASVLRSWVASNPQDASAYALLAQVLSLANLDEQAWASSQTALNINPALPIVQRNHARLLLKQQKIDDALQASQLAYQNDVSDPENQLVLANAMMVNNQIEPAFALVARALQSRPGYAEAIATRGLLKLRSNDFAGALADVEMALSIKPHLWQLWGIVGSLRHQFRNLAGAIEALEKALDHEPGNVLHMVNLGEFRRQAGALEAAIAILEKAVAIASDNPSAWANLGTALHESQRIPEAKAAYSKALEIKPELPEVASNLGVFAKDEGNWEEALRYFDQALAYQPTRVVFMTNRAAALNALGRYYEAEQALCHVKSIDPDCPVNLCNLGNTFRGSGRLAEAVASYRRALEIKPNFAEAHSNLGITLNDLGQINEAEASYRRALEINPNLVEALWMLGHTLCDLDNLKEAAVVYQKAFDLDSATRAKKRLDAAVYLAVLYYLDGNFEQCRSKLLACQSILTKKNLEQKNARIYWGYLDKLLVWHEQYRQIDNQLHGIRALYVIGESHSLCAHGVVVRYDNQEWRCAAEWISGCKQWHLGNGKANKYKHKFEAIMKRLPCQSTILLCIGEIDCRHGEGIFKAWKKSNDKLLEEVVLNTTNTYISYVTKIAVQYGHRLIVGGVPAPNTQLAALSPEVAGQIVHLIRIFNAMLKDQVLAAGMDFLDVYALTDRGDGIASGEWHIDNNHLLPSTVVEAFSGGHLIKGINLTTT